MAAVKPVRFVPPFVVASVPARVIAPVVAVAGVNPVEPAEKDATPPAPAVAEMVIVPLPLVTVTLEPPVIVVFVSEFVAVFPIRI